MRFARWLSGVTLVLALPAGTPAAAPDAVLYTAVVTQIEADVRSGPSDDAQLYPTNRLHQGDQVQVVREVPGGWLAIKPPPGSYSWIKVLNNVQQMFAPKPMWLVLTDGTPVMMGSEVHVQGQKPTVEAARLPRGSQVRGEQIVEAEDGRWLRIEPPAREVRYIRKEAFAAVGTSARAPAATPATLAAATPPGGVPAPGAPATSGPDPRWLQAQQLEQAGRFDEAIRAYTDLGYATVKSNYDLAMQAFNRAEWLRKAHGSAPARPAMPAGAPETGGTVATTANRVGGAPPAATPVPAQGPPPLEAATPSWPGRLIRAGNYDRYRPTYMLLGSDGRPRMIVTGQPGLDLEPYVGRNVEVSGSLIFRRDLATYYLTASNIRLLP